MRIRIVLISVICTVSLTHCATYDFSRRVVQQGNLLQPEITSRLKLGMSKEDVAILLGTSLLSPTFNNDRWDYAYTYRRGNGPMILHNRSLYFKQGALMRIELGP